MTGNVNPLTGRPLEPWQVLVTGPAETGYRQTVVDARPGATLPRWITRVELLGAPVFVDTGIPGGTYTGAQELPTLEVTAKRDWSGLWLVLGGLAVVGLIRGQGARDWR